jgi:hypothetical protein
VIAFKQTTRLQFQLQDILALVIGYGMAALLFRAFWPSSRPSPALGVPGFGLYLWLGLAMSGPIILFRRGPRRTDSAEPSSQSVPVGSRTWAELAWLLIGIYWIVLGSFVIPARLHEFKFGDTVLFGLVPIVVALGFRLFGPKPLPGRDATSGWTHSAAIALLTTWPIAWICLIVLGKSLH